MLVAIISTHHFNEAGFFMNRRNFLSGFSKLSLVPVTASIVTAVSMKNRNVLESSAKNLEKQIKSLKNQFDKLEDNQKKMLKTLVLITAVSTGFDLSLML
jgi:hypothetical protein